MKDTNAPSPRHFKAWRKAAGLTQDAAAELMGLSRPQIANLEAGRRDWDGRFVIAAAAAYGTSVYALLHRAPQEKPGLQEMADALDAETLNQLEDYARFLLASAAAKALSE